VTLNFAWQEIYRKALIELSREELPRRIQDAENAIHQRIEELRRTGECSSEEQQAIADALRMLRVLAQSECQVQKLSQACGAESEATS
jgi:hypothetical protein